MKLTVVRDTRHCAIFSKWELSIDGTVVGSIGKGESLSFDVAEGKHILSVKIKGMSDPTYSFDASCGDKIVRIVYNETTFKELYSFNPFKAFANSMKTSAQALKGKTLSGKPIIEFIETV